MVYNEEIFKGFNQMYDINKLCDIFLKLYEQLDSGMLFQEEIPTVKTKYTYLSDSEIEKLIVDFLSDVAPDFLNDYIEIQKSKKII